MHLHHNFVLNEESVDTQFQRDFTNMFVVKKPDENRKKLYFESKKTFKKIQPFFIIKRSKSKEVLSVISK